MISGLNQNVEILGRVFHVQTEVITGDDDRIQRKIETTVFLDGKVVGSRGMPLESRDRSENRIRSRRDQQHLTVIDTLVARMMRLQERPEASSSPFPVAEQGGTAAPVTTEAEPELPCLDDDPILLGAIRVRRLLGRFRAVIDVTPPKSHQELSEHLDKAAKMINNIVSSLTFREIRLDEQVRFNLLKQRIDEWLGGNREHDDGIRIWSRVVVFSAYLREINDRVGLRSVDVKLLDWGIHAISKQGVTKDIVGHLQSLFGVDVALDRLLNTRAERKNAERWLALMQTLLDKMAATPEPPSLPE